MQVKFPEIVASILVAIVLYYALDLPIKLAFSAIIGLLTFSILIFLGKQARSYVSHSSKPMRCYLYFVLYFLCVISVVVIPPLDGIELINWFKVPIINLVRLVSSIVLTTFLPGFIVLQAIGYKIHMLAKFIFSIIISILFTSIIEFFIVLYGLGSFTVHIFAVINLAFLTFYAASSLSHSKLKDSFKRCDIDNNETLILIMLIILQFAFTYSMLSSDFPLPMGDETYLHGFAVYSSKGEIPTSIFNPFLLTTYLSANFVLSGFPSINTFQVLHFLNILPILAFYLSLKDLLGRRFPKVPILGAVIGFFSGYTWIYVISVRCSGYGDGLYDLLWGAYSKVPGYPLAFYLAPYVTAAQMVGATAVLLLIYLTCSREELDTKRLFLISIVTAYGYLGHVFDICVYLAFFLSMILVSDLKKMPTYRRMGASLFVGLLIVVIMNLFDPAHRYSGLFLIFSLSSAALAMFASFLREKIRSKGVIIAISKLNKLAKSRCTKIATCFSLIYLYGLSILTYLYVLPAFNIWATFFETKYGDMAQIVPWYSYPIIMGTAGFLSLAGVLYFVSRENGKKEEFYPYLMLAVLTILIALGLRLFPITLESRLLTYLWVPICVFAAYSVSKLSDRFYRVRLSLKKKTIFSAVFMIILVTGLLSTLEYVEVLSIMNGESFPISNEEFEALNYIRFNIPLKATVLTLSSKSSSAIIGFGGTLNVIWGKYSETLFQLVEPHIVLNQLLNLRVKYIYIGPEDLELINSTSSIRDGYICTQLLQSVPIAYKNSKVTVYLVNIDHYAYGGSSESSTLIPFCITLAFTNESTEQYGLTCYNLEILSRRPITVRSTDITQGNNRDLVVDLKNNINLTEYRFALIEWKSPDAVLFFYPRGLKHGFVNMMLGQSSRWETTLIDLHSAYDFASGKRISMMGDNLTEIIFRVFVTHAVFSINKISFIKDITDYFATQKESAPPQITPPNIAYEQISMSGLVTVRTNSVFALTGVSKVTLASWNFSDEYVNGFKSIGLTELIFNADECLIKPFSGEYVYLEPKGHVNILTCSSNLVLSSTNLGTYNFTGRNLYYEVNGTDVKIFVRKPNINVQGSIYLKKSIIFDEFRRVLIDLWPCTLKGVISFNVDSSEGQIIFFNNLKYDGVLESNRPHSNSPPLNEWHIPLVQVLLSQINVIVIASAILISLKLNYVSIKLKAKRSKVNSMTKI
jgi:hypothetical protein